MTAVLWSLAILLILAGIAGTVLPALPGPVLVFGGVLIAAWAGDFTRIGWLTIGVLAVLTILAHVVDLITSALGARRAGASRRAVLGASLGVLAGLVFGLPGLIAGPFVGAFIGEFTVRRHVAQAGRAGAGAWLGLLFGVAAKLTLVFVMVGLFLAAAFFD